MKALIVDDEHLAIDLIEDYLKEFEFVDSIYKCNNGFDAIKIINEKKPDIVFLDIQMPKISGIEVLELIDVNVEIIFTTAYEEYALEAFERNATDYLLKPFSKSRFVTAFNKAVENIKLKNNTKNFHNISEEYNSLTKNLTRVVVKQKNKILIIPVDDIVCIESADDYVVIVTDKEEYIKNSRMKYFERSLNPENFVRVHRSSIVNINKIKEIQPYAKDSYCIILNNGRSVKTSRQGNAELRRILNF